MIFEADLGNTQIKWRVLSGSVVLGGGRCAYQDLSNLVIAEQLLTPNVLGQIQRVRVSSVAALDREQLFTNWSLKVLCLSPQFAEVSDHFDGVYCAYNDASLLGVDRWLALLAARRKCSGAFVVVDCGTAVTIDLMSRDNEHLGGYILPGFQTMLDSLGGKAGLAVPKVGSFSSTSPGRSTSECIANGVLLSVVALLNQLTGSGQDLKGLFVTGGDGHYLMPFFPSAVFCEALVLDGLSVVLP